MFQEVHLVCKSCVRGPLMKNTPVELIREEHEGDKVLFPVPIQKNKHSRWESKKRTEMNTHTHSSTQAFTMREGRKKRALPTLTHLHAGYAKYTAPSTLTERPSPCQRFLSQPGCKPAPPGLWAAVAPAWHEPMNPSSELEYCFVAGC